MTPTEKLTAAAEKARETAKGTTKGPWRRAADDDLGDAYPPNFVANWDGEYLRGVAEFGEGDQAERDSHWAALAHPGLAVPLDALLLVAAELVEAHPELAHPHVDGDPCEDLACRVAYAALGMAHVILGGES